MQMAFDTLKAVKELKAAGFEEAQAEAMVGAFGLAVSDNTASKTDVQHVSDEMQIIKSDIKLLKWMNGAILALAAAAFLRFVFMA